MNKLCIGPCGLEKDLEEFGPHPKGKFGKQPRCRECCRAWHRQHYAENPEKYSERDRLAAERDPEAVKEKNRNSATRWRANPENRRRKRMAYIETRYNISYADYERMELEQGGVCKICKRPPTHSRYDRLHVDHDHATGKVRGLLCHTCNTGLGSFQDRPDWLQAAIVYLSP
jgi:hypothetical protein